MAKMTVRRRAALVVAAGIVGTLPGTVDAATRSAAVSTAAYDCRYDAVSVSDAAGSAVSTARRTGVPLHAHLRVHNTEAVALTTGNSRLDWYEGNGFEYWPG